MNFVCNIRRLGIYDSLIIAAWDEDMYRYVAWVRQALKNTIWVTHLPTVHIAHIAHSGTANLSVPLAKSFYILYRECIGKPGVIHPGTQDNSLCRRQVHICQRAGDWNCCQCRFGFQMGLPIFYFQTDVDVNHAADLAYGSKAFRTVTKLKSQVCKGCLRVVCIYVCHVYPSVCLSCWSVGLSLSPCVCYLGCMSIVYLSVLYVCIIAHQYFDVHATGCTGNPPHGIWRHMDGYRYCMYGLRDIMHWFIATCCWMLFLKRIDDSRSH